MQGVVQLGDSILDDVLGFRDSSLENRKLLVQKLLLQLLLLTQLHAHIYRLMHNYNAVHHNTSFFFFF